MKNDSVIVVGGGIAGLTAASLLAHEGLDVTLLESHTQLGGCAGTFKRGPYHFDVGATQVAGLELGGIHERIFRYLKYPAPKGEVLNPACVVDLGDGLDPIKMWHDPAKWETECKKQFPGSEKFWTLCSVIHASNWKFLSRNPVLPIKNFWDLRELARAIRPINLLSGFLSKSSIADLLWLCDCHQDQRLQRFLDLQLKLYSQKPAHLTAALYGSTVLQMAQAPLGLWHLKGSMQVISDHLKLSFIRDGGKLFLRHKVVSLLKDQALPNSWIVNVLDQKASLVDMHSSDIVFSLPPQSLLELMSNDSGLPIHYRRRLRQLPKPSGALVFYGAIDRNALPLNCPGHLQFSYKDLESLFISISSEGDGRAPVGRATVIASLFTDIDLWSSLDESNYQKKKQLFFTNILKALHSFLCIAPEEWLHKELATPRSFAKWTGRPKGMVGGLGQTPSSFGPYGLPSRTPANGLWLCGDSIYPGEGTAGVSQSALMACRQLMATRGRQLSLDR